MKFYHGTQRQSLAVLNPFFSTQNTIKKSVIYLTPNPELALFYIWNRPYKWVTFEENENGRVVYTEWYENQLYEFYNRVSGSVYECDGDNPDIYLTHVKGVYNSEKPITPVKERMIPNVYESILEAEKKGSVVIKKYATLSTEEKETIEENTIRAIHMQKVLLPEGENRNAEYTEFVKQKFPVAWEKASKMTKEEIEAMINKWRASRGQH